MRASNECQSATPSSWTPVSYSFHAWAACVAEVRSWQTSMTAAELKAKVQQLAAQRDKQLEKLSSLRSGAKLVSPEERRATEAAFKAAMEVWRKRRSVFRGVW